MTLALALRVARAAIAEALGLEAASAPESGALEPWLQRTGASFVTLTLDGRLRGCVGSPRAHRPLVEDLRRNAVAAALRDPRFPPLASAELAPTRIEVSLLSPLEPLACAGEAEALALLRPGVDGLVLEAAERTALFLPQVWEDLPEPRQFLRHLRRKAALPEAEWLPGTRLLRFTVVKVREP
jgi:AmmeMemoRadiSam system protein A